MFQNKLFQMSLILLIAVALLGVITLVLWQTYFKSAEANVEETKEKELSIDEILERTVETEQITTNLYSGGYAVVKFKIQADSPKAKEELEKRMYQVKHIIIKTLASMTAADIQGADGLSLMETKIQQEINQLLDEGKVVKVYTTERILDAK